MSARRVLCCCLGFMLFAGFTSSCSNNSRELDRKIIIRSSINELKKFINLPADVERCEWQTGSSAPHGGDWWLAAVLQVEEEKIPEFLRGIGTEELFETPPGLELTSSFAALKSIAGAQLTKSKHISLVTKTYGAAPYLSSPLLHGKAISLAANQVLVILWTN